MAKKQSSSPSARQAGGNGRKRKTKPQSKYAHGCHPNSIENLKRYQWKPGQSGNPGGRPKGRSIIEEVKMMLGKKDGQLAEALASVLLQQALRGHFRFFKELLDRIDGPVANRLAGHDGGPLLDKDRQNLIDQVFANPKALQHAKALANELHLSARLSAGRAGPAGRAGKSNDGDNGK